MSVVYQNLQINGSTMGPGEQFRIPADVATTVAGTLATSFANGQTVDGVVLATGQRILIKNQSTASENGIYTVQSSGAPVRAADYDAGQSGGAVYVFIRTGATLANTTWVCTSVSGSDIIGTSSLTYQQTSGLGVDGDVITTATQTLTNKTLTAPVIATIVNTGTLTLPTSTDTLVGRATTDTLTNKTISTGSTWSGNTISVSSGGTGATSFTSGNVLVGAGTGAVTATKAAPSGAFVGTTDTQTLSAKTLTAPIIASIVNVGTLTLPTATDTLVARTTTDTLTNKTLTAPVIATIVNTGTLTLPTSTDTLVARATTDTLSNKTLDTSCVIADTSSPTKKVAFSLSGMTAVRTLTISSTQSTNQTLAIPDVGSGDIFVTNATTATLTNKTLTAPVIATIVNTGTLTLPTSTDTLVARATTDTLSNKTLDTTCTIADTTTPTKKVAFSLAGMTAAVTLTLSSTQSASQTLAIPNVGSGDTIVTNATTATLTNKTLSTGSTWSGNTITVANGGTGATTFTSGNVLVGAGTSAVTATQAAPTGAFVGTTDTQTLTNKTITGTTNSVDASGLLSATTTVNVSSATAPIAGQVLTATSTTAATWQNATGGVTGPGSSTDNAIALFNGTSGSVIKNSTVLISSGAVSGVTTLRMSGSILDTNGNSLISQTATASAVNFINIKNAATGAGPTITATGTDTTIPLTFAANADEAGTNVLDFFFTNAGNTSRYLDIQLGSAGSTITQTFVLNSPSSRTYTFPDATGIIVLDSNAQLVSNKNLAACTLADGTDATKQIAFSLSGMTTAITLTISSTQSTSRSLAIPNVGAGDSFVTNATTATLTNKTLTAPVIGTIVNTGTLTLPTSTDTIVGRATTDTLSNKTLDTSCTIADTTTPTKKVAFSLAGMTAAVTLTLSSTQSASQSLAIPNVASGDAIVTNNTTATLTNKTLTSPIIGTIVNTGTLTLPTTTDTLMGRVTTDTISNKTMKTTCVFADTTTTTKQLALSLVGMAAATTLTISTSQLATQTLTIPAVGSGDSFVTNNTTATLTNKTMTASTNNVTAQSLFTGSGAGSVSSFAATAPSVGQVLTATSATVATWQNIPSAGAFGGNFTSNFLASSSTTSASLVTVPGAGYPMSVAVPAGSYIIEWAFIYVSSATNNSLTASFRVGAGVTAAEVGQQIYRVTATTVRDIGYFKWLATTASSTTYNVDLFISVSAGTFSMSQILVTLYRVT